MIHVSNCVSSLRLLAASSLVVVAGLVFVSAARAVDFDFNVASGNFTTSGNWVDVTNAIPVPTAATPTVADRAFVRNTGTVTINSNVAALQMRIGYENVVTNPDYNGNGIVDGADYVLWRKGGPLQNDATPSEVGPDDYTYWRYRFGGTPLVQELGQSGTLMWTAGEITGTGPIGGDPYSGGPDIRVGRVRTTNSVVDEVTGTVIQNGPTTKLMLPYQQSQLTIGDGTAATHTPTSSYTLMDGTIGLGIGSTVYQNNGTNGNSGIHARNGTFTMTGGQVIDATPTDYFAFPLTTQRFLTVATATGAGEGDESLATANLSGGSIDVLGGIRVATANHSRGYLNIDGPITIKTGGDTSIGYQPNTNGVNAVGEMNMSAGSLQIGRTDIAGQNLIGRFQIGDRGKGILNMSGGSISVTRNIRVVNNVAAAGSIITMTGGTITTPNLEMRVTAPAVADTDVAASIILDGPTASFVQTTTAGSTGATIGNNGKALFEVRQGTALLGGGGSTIQVGNSALAASLINVKGGKLTLGGPLNRANLSSAAPVIGLTGGNLEWNPTAAIVAFQADLINSGTRLTPKPNAVLRVDVGSASPSIPANFAMTGGSWDIEIGTHNVAGADWFNVPNGTAALTGGTLNISYLAGFTPNPGDVFTIVDGNTSVPTLGAVTIAGSGAPNWSLQVNGSDIQLKWNGSGTGGGFGAAVPEPSALALLLFGFGGLLSGRSRRRASPQS